MILSIGAFLERTGIADFFIKISNSVVGGFSGGPAKVIVVVLIQVLTKNKKVTV